MREPNSTRARNLFDEVYSDPHRAMKAMTYAVYVEDVDTPLIASSVRSYSRPDAPAVACEVSLPYPLHRGVEGKELAVVLYIEGERWVDYIGEVMLASEEEEGGGSLGASTPGYWQGGEDAIKFSDFSGTQYSTTPSRALEDMLGRLPYPDVKIPDIREPRFERGAEEAYPPVAAVSEGIQAVCEEAGLIQKDDFLSSARVFVDPSIGGIVASEDPIRWQVGREISAFSATRSATQRYRDVGIVRVLSDGSYAKMVNPFPEVRYPPGVKVPPKGATYYEEISDSQTLSTDNARSRAMSVAAALSYGGEHQISFTTDFIDPRIEDMDVREVISLNHQTNETTLYRVLIESQERNYTLNQCTYAGTGVILERREARADRRPSIPVSSL